jgi:hypothetical protein
VNTEGTTQIAIRRPALSTVYRAALQPNAAGCFGYLIGTNKEVAHPIIDIALVARTVASNDEFAAMSDLLPALLPACRSTAEFAGATPLGLFASWDTIFLKDRGQLLAALVDEARRLELRLAVEFPTYGGDPLFAARFFEAARFPHEPLSYTTRSRRSEQPAHNPSRIMRHWRSCLGPTPASQGVP